MALAVVNKANGGLFGGATGTTVSSGTFSSTTGNLLVAFTRNGTLGITSVKTASGMPFTKIKTATTSPTGTSGQMWYLPNIVGNPSDSVVLIFPSQSSVGVFVWEISGADRTGPLDWGASIASASTGSSVTTLTSSAYTTSILDTITLAGANVGHANETFTPSAGWVDDGAWPAPVGAQYSSAQHIINTSVQTAVTAQISWNVAASNNVIVLATFKAAVAAPVFAPLSNNIWNARGVVVSAAQAGNPTVMYEAGAQILSPNADGKIFKMWHGFNGVNYRESSDGLTWSAATLLLSGAVALYPRIYKNGSTYYAYVTTGNPQHIDVYTSSDGITFTLAQASAIVQSQYWENTGVVQLNITTIDGGGTWYGYYTGWTGGTEPFTTFYMGLATSTDGIHWTKNALNPIITTNTSNFTWQQVSGNFYGWSSSYEPGNHRVSGTGFVNSPMSRWVASSPGGPWIRTPASTYYLTTAAELATEVDSSPVDPCILEANVNGVVGTYLYYTVTNSGTASGIGCATTSLTLAQLVATQEGVQNSPVVWPGLTASPNFFQLASDVFSGGDANPIAGNWTQLSAAAGFGTAQIVSHLVEPSTVNTDGTSFYNAVSFPNDQWSSVTISACAATSKVGVAVRQNTSGTLTAYRLYWSGALGGSGTWTLQRYLNGSAVSLDTGTITVNAGDVLTLAVVGTNLYAYYNGFIFATASNSAIASGAAGFVVFDSSAVANAQISSWSGGNANVQPAATPTFSPAAGSYGNAQTVTISSTTPGGTIYYTVDGSTPTHSSPSISNGQSIVVSVSQTVQAILSVSGSTDSAVGSAAYIIGGRSTGLGFKFGFGY